MLADRLPIRKQITLNAGKDIRERKSLLSISGNTNWSSHDIKQYRHFSKISECFLSQINLPKWVIKNKYLLISIHFPVFHYIMQSCPPTFFSSIHVSLPRWFHSLGKIKTSSPGPGMVWLYPPQPFSTSCHVSGRDHFKADSDTDVEAGTHRKNTKLTMKTQEIVTSSRFYC